MNENQRHQYLHLHNAALIEARNAAARYEDHVAEKLGFGRNTALPLLIAAPAPITWKSLDIPQPLSAVPTFACEEMDAKYENENERMEFEMRAGNLLSAPSDEKRRLLYSLGF